MSVFQMTSEQKLRELSSQVRRMIDGECPDIRDNREGALSALKNDIYTLAVMKSEQAEVLQTEKNKLADSLADIAHQLKTPLTSMLLMMDLLESAPPEKQKEFFDGIRKNLIHTEWLVTTLLKMAKLDAGTVSFTPAQMNTDELVREAVRPLAIMLDIKNQRVKVNGEHLFTCDKRWTAEALTNIIKNASEHSPEGGVITVSSGSTPICTYLCVTDSGTGISASELPKLFRRFEGSKGERGFGIGLPLALAILKGQNGDIEVDAGGKGSGASFTMKFFK